MIEKRRSYHLLTLLGDIGGIFSSIFFLFYLAHELLVRNQEAKKVLTRYFKIEKQPRRRRRSVADPKTSFNKASFFKTNFWVTLIYETFLKLLVDCLRLDLCCEKHQRISRLFARAQTSVDKSLDLRTIVRSQNLLRTLTAVLFENRHRPLFKLQRHQRVLEQVSSES